MKTDLCYNCPTFDTEGTFGAKTIVGQLSQLSGKWVLSGKAPGGRGGGKEKRGFASLGLSLLRSKRGLDTKGRESSHFDAIWCDVSETRRY